MAILTSVFPTGGIPTPWGCKIENQGVPKSLDHRTAFDDF